MILILTFTYINCWIIYPWRRQNHNIISSIANAAWYVDITNIWRLHRSFIDNKTKILLNIRGIRRGGGSGFMVINATFNNISVISWRKDELVNTHQLNSYRRSIVPYISKWFVVFYATFNNISVIVAVSLHVIGGGNRSIRRKIPTCRKSIKNVRRSK